MIYLPDQRLVFLHVSRTGGTSVSQALRPYMAPAKAAQEDVYECHEGGRHGIHLFGDVAACGIPKGWRSFAVVRWPPFRLLSMVAHGSRFGWDVSRWVDDVLEEREAGNEQPFYASQTKVLETSEGEPVADAVLRFEELPRLWRQFSVSNFGVELALPHLNASLFVPRDNPLCNIEVAQEEAYRLWPEDEQAFGYS